MTNEERARALVEHCRYCDRVTNKYFRCYDDHENDIKALAAALDEAEKRGAERLEMCNKCAWQGCQWGIALEAQLVAKDKEIEELREHATKWRESSEHWFKVARQKDLTR